MCRKSEKGAAEWKGSEAAEKQCKHSCEEAWKINENPKTRKKKAEMKIRKFEEIGKSIKMERVAERKGATGQGRWLGYSSWRQTEQ